MNIWLNVRETGQQTQGQTVCGAWLQSLFRNYQIWSYTACGVRCLASLYRLIILFCYNSNIIFALL